MKKFWQLVSKKDLIFIVVIFVAVILFSSYQSANKVKVRLGDEVLAVNSSKYSFNIGYTEIVSAELTDSPALGEPVEGQNNNTLRYGVWRNSAWGEYHLCADPDVSSCIVLHLDDGSTYVFSRKDNSTTQQLYEQLLTHIEN